MKFSQAKRLLYYLASNQTNVKMKKRIYAEEVPQHVYARGKEGEFIFYNVMDSVYFITLYCCRAPKYGIRTSAFSLMPNHIHSQQFARSRKSFILFNQEMLAEFATGYNKWHKHTGRLFDTFGSVPKHVGKTIRNNIAYINNNGPVGRLAPDVLGYKWNLLACFKIKEECNGTASKHYKRSLKAVDYYRNHHLPLSYELQERLYRHLSADEKNDLVDYILCKYNVVDLSLMVQYYDSFETAIIAMDANSGSEPEMREDWDDYSVYREMLRTVSAKGYDTRHINFETLSPGELADLAGELSTIPKATFRQVRRFLHLAKSQD